MPIVTYQFHIELLYDILRGLVPVFIEPFLEFFQFLLKLLPRCFDFRPWVAFPALSIEECKSKEIERFQLPKSSCATVLLRIPPKFYQPALAFFQFEIKLCHAFFKRRIVVLRIRFVLEPRHKIVRIVYKKAFVSCLFRDYQFETKCQYVVHINVCQRRADVTTLHSSFIRIFIFSINQHSCFQVLPYQPQDAAYLQYNFHCMLHRLLYKKYIWDIGFA